MAATKFIKEGATVSQLMGFLNVLPLDNDIELNIAILQLKSESENIDASIDWSQIPIYKYNWFDYIIQDEETDCACDEDLTGDVYYAQGVAPNQRNASFSQYGEGYLASFVLLKNLLWFVHVVVTDESLVNETKIKFEISFGESL